MKKPYELTDEQWGHFILGNQGRTEEEMQATLVALMIRIAQAELDYYKTFGGLLQ